MMHEVTRQRRLARKTTRRVKIIDGLLASLTDGNIFKVIDFRNWEESRTVSYMHPHLIDGMEDVYRRLYPAYKDQTIQRNAKKAVLWEGDVGTTISHIQLFGVLHRPDFVVNAESVRIAVEIKRGDSGSAVRDGIGQCLVYSTHYDFIVYLLIDISQDGRIRATVDNPMEAQMIRTLWDEFNVRLEVA